jgi:succinate dehydrogenase/fumarate reductase iron-sulfur protein
MADHLAGAGRGAAALPTVRVTVERSDAAARRVFDLPTHPRQTVLDALFEIQADLDPSLAFRCSCRVGMCGSCGVVVNGREGLACRTAVRTLGPEVHVGPMRHMPVIRDLVVDMAPFFAAYQAVAPWLVAREGVHDPMVAPPGGAERGDIDLGLECINCGLCYSACDVVGDTLGRFLGPAALNRAYNLVADLRDGATEERLDRVLGGSSGVWGCHLHMSCVEVCPKGIEPTRAIAHLRRRAVRRLLPLGRRRPLPQQYSPAAGGGAGALAPQPPEGGP